MSAAIDMDGLDASLDDLLKAADASDVKDRLEKAVRGEHPNSSGYSVSNSGHVDEDGQKGGGIAGMGDAGVIDDLMIGKMIDAGVAAATVANFVAFMTAQADEDMDEDDEEDEDEMEAYCRKSGECGMRKSQSYREEWSEDADIQQAVDASPFMEALTMRTTQALDGLHKSQRASSLRQSDFNEKMAKAVHKLGNLLKSRDAVIGELSKRLGIVESAPLPQRGVTGTQGLRKSIAGGATQDGAGAESLSKSEAVATLTYMNLQKGITTINGQKTAELAVMLEAGGAIDKDTLTEVQRFIATHPNEAQLAKSYQ